jgi:hypothetical protein
MMKALSTFLSAMRQILADTRSPRKPRSLAYGAAKSGDMKSTAYALRHGVPTEEFSEIASMVRARLGKCPIEDEIGVTREMAIHAAVHSPSDEQNWVDRFVFAVEKLPKAQDKFQQYKTADNSFRMRHFGKTEAFSRATPRVGGYLVEKVWKQGLNCIEGMGECEERVSAYKTIFRIWPNSAPGIQNIFLKCLAEIEAMPVPNQRLTEYCDLTLWGAARKAGHVAEDALFTHIIRGSVGVTDETLRKRADSVCSLIKSSSGQWVGGIRGDGFVMR